VTLSAHGVHFFPDLDLFYLPLYSDPLFPVRASGSTIFEVLVIVIPDLELTVLLDEDLELPPDLDLDDDLDLELDLDIPPLPVGLELPPIGKAPPPILDELPPIFIVFVELLTLFDIIGLKPGPPIVGNLSFPS